MNASKNLNINMSEQGMACSVPATVSQIKTTYKWVLASILEVGCDEFDKRHQKAIKKFKQDSHLFSAMYQQFGLLDHMAAHFTSCIVIAVSNAALYDVPLKLEDGGIVEFGLDGSVEVLNSFALEA
ncbi:MAG: hypothetical protein B7X60_01100 [Polynucleobacter sp. 39-45-136]|jgi:hypothetical protein|nr:MAG: hypothetical protein B7X60_01100 [Polynucleobacter sp. 39-45-136]